MISQSSNKADAVRLSSPAGAAPGRRLEEVAVAAANLAIRPHGSGDRWSRTRRTPSPTFRPLGGGQSARLRRGISPSVHPITVITVSEDDGGIGRRRPGFQKLEATTLVGLTRMPEVEASAAPLVFGRWRLPEDFSSSEVVVANVQADPAGRHIDLDLAALGFITQPSGANCRAGPRTPRRSDCRWAGSPRC